jgi:RNA polymerase sigma-70 factor (ECF subfamily)
MNGHPLATGHPVAETVEVSERLESLFEVHHDRLYRLARRLVFSSDDALDLVQETFLHVARAINSMPFGRTAEEAWLVRVLVNIRRDQWRKAAVRTRHRPEPEPPVDQEAKLLATVSVWKALDRLQPRRRAVVVMHELEGLPVPSIARLLGLSAITVRWHLSVGRRELAHVLKPHMGDPL